LRSLLGQVVDAAPGLGLQLDGGAVAVLGASYGGGQSWLAALPPKFDTPQQHGADPHDRAIVPWTDLLGALRPNGDLTNSIDVPGSYKLSYLAGLFLGGLRRDRDRPYPNYPDYLFIWNAYILASEPNNLPPIGTQVVDGIAGYRSIWWQQQFFQAVDENASSSPVASNSNRLHRTATGRRPGDVATYLIPAARIASDAGLAPGPFLVAGQPLVSFHASTTAYRVQFDVRLHDVTRRAKARS